MLRFDTRTHPWAPCAGSPECTTGSGAECLTSAHFHVWNRVGKGQRVLPSHVVDRDCQDDRSTRDGRCCRVGLFGVLLAS